MRLNNLRPVPDSFTGRDTELEQLLEIVRRRGVAGVAALRGVGGVGKTALAEKAAEHLVGIYLDASLCVPLRGSRAGEGLNGPATPREAMTFVLNRLAPGFKPTDDDAALADAYHHILATTRALLILDDARDAAQVRALLPPRNGKTGAIVTSRRLIVLEEIEPVPLDDLPLDDAKAMIARILGARRTLSDARLAALATACARHPLALKIAALHLRDRPHVDVDAYARRILADRSRLRGEGLEDDDVMAVLRLSVDVLEKEDAALATRWTGLGVFPADFDALGAAALWGEGDTPLEEDAAREALERLSDIGLVEAKEGGRFRLHDLLHDLALAKLDEAGRERLRLRHAAFYRDVLGRADEMFLAGGAESIAAGLALYDREQANIAAGQGFAAAGVGRDRGRARLAADYANAGAYVLELRLVPRVRIGWLETQRDACRALGDRRGEGNALGNLGAAYARLGETRKAIGFYERRLAIAREIGDRRGEGNALGNLGLAYAALGETRKAIGLYEQALASDREIGDRRGEGADLANLGLAYARLGETRKAIGFYAQAVTILREIGDRRGEGNALGNLGLAYADLGETRKAIGFYEQQLVIVREIGDRRGEGNALANWGNLLKSSDPAQARRLLGEALAIYRALEDPNAAKVERWLKELGA